MSSWGNNDNAANAPYWAVNSTIINVAETEQWHSAPDATNVAVLYANTSANVWTDRQTVGLFGVDAQEVGALEGSAHRGLHTGWVLRTTGQGGRAGRIQEEVLVAMSSMTLDNDTIAPEITITVQPADATAVEGETESFSVTATRTGTGTIGYQWQIQQEGAGAWADISGATSASYTTGATATGDGAGATDGDKYRVLVSLAGADTKTSDAATLTVA